MIWRKAKEMRRLSKSYEVLEEDYNDILEDITLHIEKAAKDGKFSVSYLLPKENDNYSEDIIKRLKKDGYKVDYYKKKTWLSDGRNGLPYHYRMNIGWKRSNFLGIVDV